MLCKSFKLVSFNIFETSAVKERHGRTGPVHHGYWFYIEKNNFLFHEPQS